MLLKEIKSFLSLNAVLALLSIKFQAKANSWENVKLSDAKYLTFKDAISKNNIDIPIYNMNDVFDNNKAKITDKFISKYPLPEVFMIKNKKFWYLVQTGGMDYIRNVTKLTN